MTEPSGSGNPKFLQPIVISFLVIEVIDFPFAVACQFLCFFRVEGKWVAFQSLVSILNKERAFYCILGVAKADAKSACWQAV